MHAGASGGVAVAYDRNMAAAGRKHESLHGSAPDRSPFALLVLDMISDFRFEGGDAIARATLPVARRIARLAERARRARVPVIFVNDNLGRWRSDLPAIVRHCARAGSKGAAILDVLEELHPPEDLLPVLGLQEVLRPASTEQARGVDGEPVVGDE